ncbi:MAG: glycosyltransferase family 2 protein [Nanoarchaeota archaeon]
MKKLEFSVIIATYDNKEFLLNCLESLEGQSFPMRGFEVIVVDDGSTDGTYNILREFGKETKLNLKVLRQRRKGPATARNFGAKKARGKILAFTDSDCIVLRNWLRNLNDAYKKYNVVGIGGPLVPRKNNFFVLIEKSKNKYLHGMGKEVILGKESVPVGFTNNMSYKSEIFRKFNGFKEKFGKPAGEDFDLKQRICKAGNRIAYIPNPVIHAEAYDVGYFLRQILKRGTRKKLTRMSNLQMVAEIIKNLPQIIYTLTKKAKGYGKAYGK